MAVRVSVDRGNHSRHSERAVIVNEHQPPFADLRRPADNILDGRVERMVPVDVHPVQFFVVVAVHGIEAGDSTDLETVLLGILASPGIDQVLAFLGNPVVRPVRIDTGEIEVGNVLAPELRRSTVAATDFDPIRESQIGHRLRQCHPTAGPARQRCRQNRKVVGPAHEPEVLIERFPQVLHLLRLLRCKRLRCPLPCPKWGCPTPSVPPASSRAWEC